MSWKQNPSADGIYTGDRVQGRRPVKPPQGTVIMRQSHFCKGGAQILFWCVGVCARACFCAYVVCTCEISAAKAWFSLKCFMPLKMELERQDRGYSRCLAHD